MSRIFATCVRFSLTLGVYLRKMRSNCHFQKGSKIGAISFLQLYIKWKTTSIFDFQQVINLIMKVIFLIGVVLELSSAIAIHFPQVPLASSPLPPSLFDRLYGELVHSPETEAHKLQLVASGKVNAATIQTFSEESDVRKLANAHEYAVTDYLKQQSKIRFPDNDDTSDINYDQTFFGGILTYAHLPHFNCFDPESLEEPLDIAIVGAPFDTAVSYRPGARFGPEAIRSNARRSGVPRNEKNSKKKTGYPQNPLDPTTHNLSIVDCGDVTMNPFDNRIALNQLYRGQRSIHRHKGNSFKIPKIVTIGGDHTITLMAIRSVHEKLGKPIHVIHFDSHIDTWDPKMLGGGLTSYMELNHGTFLHFAHEQGYITDSGNYHVGIRAPFIDSNYDKQHDHDCGFDIISARAIDEIGVKGIIQKLKNIGENEPVYITVDIDCLDPAFAPGTGTMESGGFSTRELLSILDGLKGLNVVGADVVEVSPPYDTNSEITSLAATFVIESLLNLMM